MTDEKAEMEKLVNQYLQQMETDHAKLVMEKIQSVLGETPEQFQESLKKFEIARSNMIGILNDNSANDMAYIKEDKTFDSDKFAADCGHIACMIHASVTAADLIAKEYSIDPDLLS